MSKYLFIYHAAFKLPDDFNGSCDDAIKAYSEYVAQNIKNSDKAKFQTVEEIFDGDENKAEKAREFINKYLGDSAENKTAWSFYMLENNDT